MTRMQLIRTLAAAGPNLTAYLQVEDAYRISLKSLARRYPEQHDEIADLDDMIEHIVKDLPPELLAQTAVGVNSAAQLLLTARDNSDRLKSEASFAALYGVSPVPASFGKTVRHRLTEVVTKRQTVPSISSLSGGFDWRHARRPTSLVGSPPEIRSSRQFAASNATSLAKSSPSLYDGIGKSIKAKSQLDS